MKLREKNRNIFHEDYVMLGVDPGSINCGYGIIETCRKHKSPLKASSRVSISCKYVASGRISLSPKTPLPVRLKKLSDGLSDLIRSYEPREMVIESMFFAKSIRAAFSLGQVRGIALLAAISSGLNIQEYSALEVKKAVTGYGNAAKGQVLSMVTRILNINQDTVHLTEDSADALALTLCHLQNMQFRKAVGF